jgi:hypothetical protein
MGIRSEAAETETIGVGVCHSSTSSEIATNKLKVVSTRAAWRWGRRVARTENDCEESSESSIESSEVHPSRKASFSCHSPGHDTVPAVTTRSDNNNSQSNSDSHSAIVAAYVAASSKRIAIKSEVVVLIVVIRAIVVNE